MRVRYILSGTVLMLILGTVYSYSVFRGPIQEAYGANHFQSGLPYMVALAFYALFMFLTGKQINRFKPRTILLMGSTLVSLGWVLSSFTTSIYGLTVTYGVITGAGVGIAYGVPMNVAAKWFPDKKGLAVGLVLVGFGLSPLIMAPVANQIIHTFGIHQTFLMLGVVFAFLLSLLSLMFKLPLTHEVERFQAKINPRDTSVAFKTVQMIKERRFYGLYVNYVIGTMMGLMLVGITSIVGIEYVGLSRVQVAGIVAILAIFNGLGRPFFGWLTDRWQTKSAIYLSYAMISMASLLLVLFGKGHEPVYFISFAIFWFNLGGWLAIAPTATMKHFGATHYSQNYGLMFTAYGLGAILGVSVSGYLVDLHGDYTLIFMMNLGLCTLGALLTHFMIKTEKASPQT